MKEDGDPNAGDAATDDAGLGVQDAAAQTFSIEPLEPTLTISGSPASQSFSALLDGQLLPKVAWILDNPLLGSIDEGGVFHSAGKVAGTAKISAQYGLQQTSTYIHVVSNLAYSADGVTPAQKAALDGAPNGNDAQFRWVYPYDGTVFPRGLGGPDLQFAGGGVDALRIALTMGNFSFTGYFKPASVPVKAASGKPNVSCAPSQIMGPVSLPADIWDALTMSADGMEAVTVEVTKLAGDKVIGPLTQRWRIAPGDLKGIVYYNTYKSASTKTGAIMRIKPGSDAEVMIGGCTVCHSVSAQGNVLSAGVQWGADDDKDNPKDSATFDLNDDGSSPVRYNDDDGRKLPFAGLTPDGRWLISNGVPSDSPIRGVKGPLASKLFDSKTGAEVLAPSFTDKVKYAVSPAFSPDARRLAFTWYDADKGNGKQLVMMDVDLTMDPPAFGSVLPVTTVSSGIAGWPSFFPDGKGIVYQEGQRFDTGLHGGGAVYAELRLADTEGAVVRRLNALNGWRADNDSYLPFGEDEEGSRNYEPSVLPVPVGGYYWVLFTSRRAYGSTLSPCGSVERSDDEWGKPRAGEEETPSVRKKLWVAAIDIDYTGKIDPSHPAFYLPGQELLAGNMRGYSALEPCRSNGDDCASGADCCGGFCRYVQTGDVGGLTPICIAPPEGCSNVDESCQTSADCCGVAAGDTCINNRCAAPNIFLQ